MNVFDELFWRDSETLVTRPPQAGVPEALRPFLRDGLLQQPVERRVHPLTGERTHINLARANRPIVSPPASPSASAGAAACVFCPGNEARTPEEPGGGDRLRAGEPWTLRAFPNLFPWLIDHRNIIETPRHATALADVDADEEIAALFAAAALGRAAEAVGLCPVLFRNHGAATSQPHPHWQSGALPGWPSRDRAIHERATAFFGHYRQNIFDVLWTEEERRGERWIGALGNWAVFSPFAPRFEHEVWLVCTTSRASLSVCRDHELRMLGWAMTALLRALAEVCAVADILIAVHQLPGESELYRLFVELCPQTIWAGAERGFAEWVVENPPERTAQLLRPRVEAQRAALVQQVDP